ncbi:MAG: hypothetical protein AAB840_01740, partial [Patescibacteria group bacterium]
MPAKNLPAHIEEQIRSAFVASLSRFGMYSFGQATMAKSSTRKYIILHNKSQYLASLPGIFLDSENLRRVRD